MTQATKISKEQLLAAIEPFLAIEKRALRQFTLVGTWDLDAFSGARDLTEAAGISWDFEGWARTAETIKNHGLLGGVVLG